MVTKITINKAPSPILSQGTFQGQQSFVQRLIEVGVTLASNPQNGQPNSFAGTDGSDNVTLSGNRARVRIENSGAAAGSRADVAVYGLTPSLMNDMSSIGQVFDQVSFNAVEVLAGDVESGMTPVFSGTAMYAYPDYNSAPDVAFRFVCQSGALAAVAPAAASSFPGPTDVATIMAGLARQMGVGFQNNGVEVTVSNPYLSGSAYSQIRTLAEQANVNADVVNNVLILWPIGGSRTSTAGPVPLVSPETGMVGYPTFSPNGYMIVKSIFNPRIDFGGTVEVESAIPQANRTWVVQKLDLFLESLVPGGNWLSTMYCYPLGFTAPPPPGA